VTGAISYRVALWTSAWTPITIGTALVATIQWHPGIEEYGLFAVFPTGEARLVTRFWTNQ